jgi:hypothetical protein
MGGRRQLLPIGWRKVLSVVGLIGECNNKKKVATNNSSSTTFADDRPLAG